jgi:TetR/AcrR family transcriptional regulator, transcriptional repressor for nem operon
MPRSSNLNRAEILARAMHYFWEHGFGSAPIDALVVDIGTTRFSLYQQFGSKLGLYIAALDHYSDTVVTQAAMLLSGSDSGLARIHNYFEFLIKSAQRSNSLTHGCLMANTMVEFGSSDAQISAKVDRHFERITRGMQQALRDAKQEGQINIENINLKQQAIHLAIFAQGLWLRARAGESASRLRQASKTAISMLN